MLSSWELTSGDIADLLSILNYKDVIKWCVIVASHCLRPLFCSDLLIFCGKVQYDVEFEIMMVAKVKFN